MARSLFSCAVLAVTLAGASSARGGDIGYLQWMGCTGDTATFGADGFDPLPCTSNPGDLPPGVDPDDYTYFVLTNDTSTSLLGEVDFEQVVISVDANGDGDYEDVDSDGDGVFEIVEVYSWPLVSDVLQDFAPSGLSMKVSLSLPGMTGVYGFPVLTRDSTFGAITFDPETPVSVPEPGSSLWLVMAGAGTAFFLRRSAS